MVRGGSSKQIAKKLCRRCQWEPGSSHTAYGGGRKFLGDRDVLHEPRGSNEFEPLLGQHG
jgi:hypothetical protein